MTKQKKYRDSFTEGLFERIRINDRMQKKPVKMWKIRAIRPEEIYQDPTSYFDEIKVEKYARSSGMRNAQRRIANRILELVELDPMSGATRILDLGCGVGYTTEVYKERGYGVVGLDINPKMLEYAIARELSVVLGDMRNISQLFEPNSFQGVVSVSALQWLTQHEDIKQVAKGINYVLSDKGVGAIQFYPKSEDALDEACRIFRREGFLTEIVTDSPENPRKRVCYLTYRKN
jgi:ubiquinone/menaquinone biosynthesis C-methylase UbiE